MNEFRAKKASLVAQFNKYFSNSEYLFVVEYAGVDAENTLNLRARLKREANDTRMDVVKNTLSFIASRGTRYENIYNEKLSNQIGLIFTSNPVEVAKIIDDFSNKTSLKLVFYTNSLSKFDAESLKKLSQLPPLPVLRAQLLSTLCGSASSLLRVLNEPASAFTRVLDAYSKQS